MAETKIFIEMSNADTIFRICKDRTVLLNNNDYIIELHKDLIGSIKYDLEG